MAARRNGIDAFDSVIEAVGEEMGEGVLVGVSACRGGGDAQNAQREDQRQQAFAEGTHISSPGITRKGGGQQPPARIHVMVASRSGPSAFLGGLVVVAALE